MDGVSVTGKLPLQIGTQPHRLSKDEALFMLLLSSGSVLPTCFWQGRRPWTVRTVTCRILSRRQGKKLARSEPAPIFSEVTQKMPLVRAGNNLLELLETCRYEGWKSMPHHRRCDMNAQSPVLDPAQDRQSNQALVPLQHQSFETPYLEDDADRLACHVTCCNGFQGYRICATCM